MSIVIETFSIYYIRYALPFKKNFLYVLELKKKFDTFSILMIFAHHDLL